MFSPLAWWVVLYRVCLTVCTFTAVEVQITLHLLRIFNRLLITTSRTKVVTEETDETFFRSNADLQ